MTTQHNDIHVTPHLAKTKVRIRKAAQVGCTVLVLGLLVTSCTPQEAGRKSRGGRWTQVTGYAIPTTSSHITS